MIRTDLETKLGKISYLYREGDIPVIFLHGLGSTGNSFMRLMKYFPETYSLSMIDLLGHGRSSKPEITYTIDQQAESVWEFIQSLSLKKFTLVGNSYGGWIAMRVFERWKPEANLVLISSAGVKRVQAAPRPDESFIEMVVKSNSFNARKVIEKILLTNQKERRIDENTFANNVPRTLIFWGKQDKVIPISSGDMLRDYIPGSRMLVIDDGGHTVHYTHPEIVAKEIISFIQSQ